MYLPLEFDNVILEIDIINRYIITRKSLLNIGKSIFKGHSMVLVKILQIKVAAPRQG